jgi:multidrug efflux pump
MTSFALILGVVPMAIPHGAGGAIQQGLGTTVIGGVVAVVVLALLMVPVFFVSVLCVFGRDRERTVAACSETRTLWTHRPHRPSRVTAICPLLSNNCRTRNTALMHTG